jgi:hypothetical protein
MLVSCTPYHIYLSWNNTCKFEQDTCFCWIENNGNIGFRDWWWWPQWGQALAHHHQESGGQALGLPWARFDLLLEAAGHLGLTLTEHWWHISFAYMGTGTCIQFKYIQMGVSASTASEGQRALQELYSLINIHHFGLCLFLLCSEWWTEVKDHPAICYGQSYITVHDASFMEQFKWMLNWTSLSLFPTWTYFPAKVTLRCIVLKHKLSLLKQTYRPGDIIPLHKHLDIRKTG